MSYLDRHAPRSDFTTLSALFEQVGHIEPRDDPEQVENRRLAGLTVAEAALGGGWVDDVPDVLAALGLGSA